jgi:homoaconitase/3-isopropylmalate dehydratase large subunit
VNITKDIMMDAAPHIMAAERHLEALRYFVVNKDRLSLDARVPMYLNMLIREISAMQQMFYDQQEFFELFARTLAEVSKDREYHFAVTKDNDGKMYFDTHGLLPLEQVQRHMLLTGGIYDATITVSGPEYTRSEEV